MNDGRIQEGFFVNGALFGLAKEMYPNGDAFVGQLINYAKNGKGTYYFSDGTRLESLDGKWSNGLKEGTFSRIDKKGKKQ